MIVVHKDLLVESTDVASKARYSFKSSNFK